MTVFEKIKELLDAAKVSYEVIEHEPVYTSAEAAKIRDVGLSQGAKSLVLYGDKKPFLAVVPADKRASFRKIKDSLGFKDLRMAPPEKVEEITTLKIGSIPPLGKAVNLPSYFDNGFLTKEKVAFNAGSHTISIIMSAHDLIAVENPQMFDIVE